MSARLTGHERKQMTMATGAALAALIGVGCGGGGGAGASCANVQPCGGNIVGNWNIVDECLDANAVSQLALDPTLLGFCPTASFSSFDLKASGTVSFNADMTYGAQENLMVGYDINVPSSCLQGLSCATLSDSIRANIALDPADSQDITFDGCSGSAVCACHFQGASTMPESGRYATSGTVLATSPTGGTPAQEFYCAQGDTLYFLAQDMTMNMGPMGTMTVSGEVVLQRR